MRLRSLRFLSLLFTSMALGPALAHLFESPNKINLSVASDLANQQNYRIWTVFGVIIACALVTTLVLTIRVRRQQKAFICSLIASLCLAGAAAAFWAFSYSVNQATGAWAMAPTNWQELRQKWEVLEAAAAAMNSMALTSLNLSLIARTTSKRASRSKAMKIPITGATENARTQFLQNMASFHSSWYEAQLAEFRRSIEENQGRHEADAA